MKIVFTNHAEDMLIKRKITKDEARTKIMKLDEYGRYGTEIIKKALEKSGDKSE